MRSGVGERARVGKEELRKRAEDGRASGEDGATPREGVGGGGGTGGPWQRRGGSCIWGEKFWRATSDIRTHI